MAEAPPPNVEGLVAPPNAGGFVAPPNVGGFVAPLNVALAAAAPNDGGLLVPWPNWNAAPLLVAVLSLPNVGVPKVGFCVELNPPVPVNMRLSEGDDALLAAPNEGVVPWTPKGLAPLLVLLLLAAVPKLKEALGDVAPKVLDDPNGDAGLPAAVPKLGVDIPKVGVLVVGAPKPWLGLDPKAGAAEVFPPKLNGDAAPAPKLVLLSVLPKVNGLLDFASVDEDLFAAPNGNPEAGAVTEDPKVKPVDGAAVVEVAAGTVPKPKPDDGAALTDAFVVVPNVGAVVLGFGKPKVNGDGVTAEGAVVVATDGAVVVPGVPKVNNDEAAVLLCVLTTAGANGWAGVAVAADAAAPPN